MALGHTLLIIIYHVIAEAKEYQELGADYLDQLERQGKEKLLVHQLEKLGFEVALTPLASQASQATASDCGILTGSSK